MIAVLDTSAGFELLTATTSGSAVRRMLQDVELTIAPDLYISEMTNVCWKAVERKELSFEQAVSGLRFSLSIVDVIKPSREIAVEALHEARTHGHSAYDLMYLIAARREGASLVTLDKGMSTLAKKMGIALAKLR